MARSNSGFPENEEFSKHAENLAELKRSRTQIERLHKAAIRRNSLEEVATLSQIQYMFIGIEAESTLRKIVTDPTGLTAAQQNVVWNAPSKTDQWLKLLDVAFAHHYNETADPSWTVDNLDALTRNRYGALRKLVTDELRPITERRNKLAHGQWAWHLKSHQDNKFTKEERQASAPDYFTLHELTKALESIANLVLALTVSRPTFERDFEKYYQRFSTARAAVNANQDGSEYHRFVSALQETVPPERKPR